MLASAHKPLLGSIVVSIPACHAGDRGSIPRRGGRYFLLPLCILNNGEHRTFIYYAKII